MCGMAGALLAGSPSMNSSPAPCWAAFMPRRNPPNIRSPDRRCDRDCQGSDAVWVPGCAPQAEQLQTRSLPDNMELVDTQLRLTADEKVNGWSRAGVAIVIVVALLT